jgi:hypothetical protein
MAPLIYPAGDEQQTLNLGLATWGMDEVLAQNMILIDASAVKINGSLISNLNFVNSASVTFSVVGSNVSATSITGAAAWATLTGDLTENQVIPWDGPIIGTPDTGISRIGVDSLAIGNGTQGDFSGSLKLTGISIQGALTDGSASVGTSGQVLSSTVTGTKWVTPASGGSTVTLTAAAPTVTAGQIGLGSTTNATIGANGGAAGLTALPVGYIIVNVGGTNYEIPFYNV